MNEQQQKYEILVTAPSEEGNHNHNSNTDKTSYWIACYLFSVVLAIFSSYCALSHGNPTFITRGFDPNHRPCGIDEMKDYPFIYFVNPQASSLSASLCVQNCPSVMNEPSLHSRLNCYPNSRVHSCSLNLHPKEKYILIIYDSFAYMDNVCVPVNSSYFNAVKQELKQMHSVLFDTMDSIPLITTILCLGLLEQLSVGFLYSSKYIPQSKLIYFLSGLSCFNVAAWFSLGSVFLFGMPLTAFQTENKEVLVKQESAMEALSGSIEQWWVYMSVCIVCFAMFVRRVCFFISRKHITKTWNAARLLLDFSQQIIEKHQGLRFFPLIQGFLIILVQLLFYWILQHLLTIVEISADPLVLPFSHLEQSHNLLEVTLFVFLLPAFVFTVCIIENFAMQVHYQAAYGILNHVSDYQENHHNSLLGLLKITVSSRIGVIVKHGVIAGITNWIQYPLNLLERNWEQNKEAITAADAFQTKWGYLRSLQEKICQKYASSWIKHQNTTNFIKSMLLEHQYLSWLSEQSCSPFETDLTASLALHVDIMKESNILLLFLVYSFCHVLFLKTALSNTFIVVLILCRMLAGNQSDNRKTICQTMLFSYVLSSQKHPSEITKASVLQFMKYLRGCLPKIESKIGSNQSSISSIPNASFLSIDSIQKNKGKH